MNGTKNRIIIWKLKRDNQLSLKDEISMINLPDKFSGISKDIKETHKAKEVKFGKFKTRIGKSTANKASLAKVCAFSAGIAKVRLRSNCFTENSLIQF